MNDRPASAVPLRALIARASVEVTPRDPAIVETLTREFDPGSDVHVTFLPDDVLVRVEETCATVRRAGFNPIPHLTARNFASRDVFADHLARLSGEAQVTRALVISGDVDKPRGEFSSSIELMRTGLLQKHGIESILIAGHPEGHPVVPQQAMEDALAEKIAFAAREGLRAEIVTQFVFEAEPVLDWLQRLRSIGIKAPVRIGVAGPASTASLIKFALRCGIGNSMRALRKQGSAIGKLMGDTKPDELLRDISRGAQERNLGPLAGIHLYMFGGAAKTGRWLTSFREEVAAPVAQEEWRAQG